MPYSSVLLLFSELDSLENESLTFNSSTTEALYFRYDFGIGSSLACDLELLFDSFFDLSIF